ncbi:MAG TPA: type II toxin-antitoxin system HicB family antitoxin [Humisphaera sp.]|jgi:predicted RNase H-like HicB family nuclease|nr:type II toxin-antitoxin system HicB family antitoxin [Humisphaera sp.]
MKYTYIIEKADDGSFSAYVPDLPGCTSCGDTVMELRANIREAVALYIESLREHGEAIPAPSTTAETVEAA